MNINSFSTGSHGEPDAWAAVGQDGRLLWAERRREMVARYVVDGTPIVPLYRQPQHEPPDENARLRLTDEERAAIEWAINKTARTYDDPEGGPMKREAMRGLLQRTK